MEASFGPLHRNRTLCASCINGQLEPGRRATLRSTAFLKTLAALQAHKLLIYSHANNPNALRFTRDSQTTTITVNVTVTVKVILNA